ncbi:MAG: SurA N-terminal domain-containing protein [Clostridiaceae bacterium]
MKMNKKVIICVAIAICTVSFVGFKATINNNAATLNDKAENMQYLEKNKENSKKLAEVNGEYIYENDLKQAKLSRDDNLGDAELLDILISDKVILKKAEEKSLEASDEEVKQSIKHSRETISTLSSDEKNQVDELIKNSGLSEEEYWNTVAYKVYKDMISINKVVSYYEKDSDVSKAKDSKEKYKIVSNKLKQKSNIKKL